MAASRTRTARYARKRRRRLSRHTHDLSTEQWEAMCDAWGGCAYCGAVGVALQKDTVLAISRGGRYTVANVVPACRSCNASKCNDEVTSWMRRKRLDEAAFLVRLHAVTAELEARFAGELPSDDGGPTAGTG